jgi:hypothetical protein
VLDAKLVFSELRTPMHQIMSTTTLLRAELLEPLGQIGDDTASGVVTDLLNNLEMAQTQLDRNISSILAYFSSLAANSSSLEGQAVASSSPAKSLGQVFETGLPPLIRQCKDIRQRDGMSSDVDIIVDFGKPAARSKDLS